jgi:hypothetical protein
MISIFEWVGLYAGLVLLEDNLITMIDAHCDNDTEQL